MNRRKRNPRSPSLRVPAPRPRTATAPRRNVREELYVAALACFERYGVRKTLMDDVAQEAGVSRPTIYYYFPDKDALVLEVIVRQGREIHQRIREKVRSLSGMAAIVEAAVHSIRISRTDQYVRLLTQPDSQNLTARVVESDIVMGLRREFWDPILESAGTRGELRADRSIDDIIRWITFVEFSMITNGESFDFNDPSVIREQLETFLVPALLPHAKR